MTDIEKTQHKITHADFYALKNVELLLPDQLNSDFSSRVHVKALGNSMNGAGIFSDDLLVIDRSLPAKTGHVVLAHIYGQFTLKKLIMINGKTILQPENAEYKSILVSQDCDYKVIGVLLFNIHKHV